MISGANFIGSKSSAKGEHTFQSFDPVGYRPLPELFYEASEEEINEACELANQALEELYRCPKHKLAVFLRAVRLELEQFNEEITKRYVLESGLSMDRAHAEFNRTVELLTSYASLIDSPDFPPCSIDLPASSELPTLRKTQIGIGPVLVFGASNFPLAYSTVGGDTVSAWTAGCPVMVKSHPMHAGTGELVSLCIRKAVKKTDMPEGIFSNLNGKSFEVGTLLVKHPLIKAVGFTGSFRGGRTIFNLAASRNEPIPVFAEMGSLNPVVILTDKEVLFSEYAGLLAKSITKDAGQFCTKPGVLFVPEEISERFVRILVQQMTERPPFRMLHPDLLRRYTERLDEIEKVEGVEQLRKSKTDWPMEGNMAVSKTTMHNFLQNGSLQEEVFGPHVLVVSYRNSGELEKGLRILGGQLTLSIFGETDDFKQLAKLNVIVHMAGRIVWNGVPTGVLVNSSSNHGGPYPASTDSRFSAVGLESWKRFSKGIVFQNAAQENLPDELKDDNPLGIVRKVNGKLTI